MSEARYQPVADLLDGWRDNVLSGEPPTLYPVGDGDLGRLEVGPGLVTLFGGAPGMGKTALTMQLVCEALERTPALRALICNVEMGSSALARPATRPARRHRPDDDPIPPARGRARRTGRAGLAAVEHLSERLAFVRPPFTLANVAASADAFEASLIVIDYIQRIGSPGEHGDRRGAVDATMGYLRQFADAGAAIIVIAALARSKDAKGRSSYSGEALSLASFRETSELEYGADDAFILPGADDGESNRPRHAPAPEEPQRRDAGHRPELRPPAPAVHTDRSQPDGSARRRGQAPGRTAGRMGKHPAGRR